MSGGYRTIPTSCRYRTITIIDRYRNKPITYGYRIRYRTDVNERSTPYHFDTAVDIIRRTIPCRMVSVEHSLQYPTLTQTGPSPTPNPSPALPSASPRHHCWKATPSPPTPPVPALPPPPSAPTPTQLNPTQPPSNAAPTPPPTQPRSPHLHFHLDLPDLRQLGSHTIPSHPSHPDPTTASIRSSPSCCCACHEASTGLLETSRELNSAIGGSFFGDGGSGGRLLGRFGFRLSRRYDKGGGGGGRERG